MIKILNKEGSIHTLEWGTLLSLCGIPISLIIKEILGGVSFDLTNIVFIISLLLIPNYNNLIKFKFPSLSRLLFSLFLFQLYIIIFAILYRTENSHHAPLVLNIYVIIFLVFISTQDRVLDSNYFIKLVWIISGIFNILMFYIVTNHLTEFNNLSFSYLSTGGDRLSLSTIVFIHLNVTILYTTDNKIEKFMKYIFILTCIYNAVACTRRGLLVSYAITLIIHFYYKLKINKARQIYLKSILNTFIRVVIGIGLIYIAIKINKSLIEQINWYFERVKNGIDTFLGNTSINIDQAALSRTNHWKIYSELYLYNSNIVEFIIGRGYNFSQLDIPYLQAFVDMGLLGGIVYIIFQLFIPIKMIFTINNDKSLNFIKYFVISILTQNIYSGIPYGYYKFVGLIVLFYLYVNVRKKSRENNKIYKCESEVV